METGMKEEGKEKIEAQEFIKVMDVSKDYITGEITVHALRNVSFEIQKQEMIVILGPSGSGKSTMLNILGGIETASAGEICFLGQSLDWMDKKALTVYRRKHVGFVFQFYNLLPGLTALENVELAAELGEHPLDPVELIRQVGLHDRADHFPSRLSGGEQQRVAIARALCKNPDILLCDEPTGALDSKTSVQVLNLLSEFHTKYQIAIVIITHNQNIAQIADRVFYFRDGCLERIEKNPNPRKPTEVEWK